MGCGCSGRKNRQRRRVQGTIVRSTNTNTNNANAGNTGNQASNNDQLSIQGVQNNQENPTRLDSNKRRIEKLKRAAIKKALNK